MNYNLKMKLKGKISINLAKYEDRRTRLISNILNLINVKLEVSLFVKLCQYRWMKIMPKIIKNTVRIDSFRGKNIPQTEQRGKKHPWNRKLLVRDRLMQSWSCTCCFRDNFQQE